MIKQVDFESYTKFVDAVTSDESRDFLAFTDRIVNLDEKGANIERLLTGAVGINSEGGEIMEIVKKLVFQGKPWSDETVFHLKRELGDVLWYVLDGWERKGNRKRDCEPCPWKNYGYEYKCRKAHGFEL